VKRTLAGAALALALGSALHSVPASAGARAHQVREASEPFQGGLALLLLFLACCAIYHIIRALRRLVRRPAVEYQPPKPKPVPIVGFLGSVEWRKIRYQALKLHGAKCQCCGATRKEGAIIQVDHIKPRSRFPELELKLSNLQVLCRDCNLGKRARDETDWR
jgi:hypothetical protein